MSDYLSRLVQRERGVAPLIEPRLPGRFEPWLGRNRVFEEASAEPFDVSGEVGPTLDRPQRASSSALAPERVERAAFGDRAETAAQPFSPAGKMAHAARREDRVEDVSSASGVADSMPPVAIQQTLARRQERRHAQTPEACAAFAAFEERGAAPTFLGAPTIAQVFDRVAPAGDRRRAGMAGGASAANARETIVEVRIGRIDVRAAPTSTAAPSPRAPARQPRRSLDDFLSGGRPR